LLVSGLLAEEAEEVYARLEAAGLRRLGSREREDASGTTWLGLDLSA
jgi:hypothetical protein